MPQRHCISTGPHHRQHRWVPTMTTTQGLSVPHIIGSTHSHANIRGRIGRPARACWTHLRRSSSLSSKRGVLVSPCQDCGLTIRYEKRRVAAVVVFVRQTFLREKVYQAFTQFGADTSCSYTPLLEHRRRRRSPSTQPRTIVSTSETCLQVDDWLCRINNLQNIQVSTCHEVAALDNTAGVQYTFYG